MNEVENMYRNAHVYPRVYKDITKETFENKEFNMADMCNEAFTAEKQLELVKWLAKKPLTIDNVDGEFEFLTGCKLSDFGNFEESLAEIINNLWQDLTEEECKQIKEILE